MLRKFLKNWLRILASKILIKYRPRIVAITGSTGKTTTKDAVFEVLKKVDEQSRGLVAKTQGNLNTEFGVTASIIDPSFTGTNLEGKTRLSIKDTVNLTIKASRLLLGNLFYPQILVLELAADRPGDIQYFMEFITPEIGILTNIGDVHLEFFPTKADLVNEKKSLIANISIDGLAILNADDEFSNLVSKSTTAKKVFIGIERKADYTAHDIGLSHSGIHFTVSHDNKSIKAMMPVYGQQFVYAALTAFAVADYFGISIDEISKKLNNFKSAPGRFERINLNQLILIDDTYNANPTSMLAALKSLARLDAQRRKVAILGDMRELGSAYQESHQRVGQAAANSVDLLMIIGEGGELIKQSAIEAGFPAEQAISLDISSARDVISTHLRDNDTVLVKGSRAVGMDKIVDLIKQKFSHE